MGVGARAATDRPNLLRTGAGRVGVRKYQTPSARSSRVRLPARLRIWTLVVENQPFADRMQGSLK